MLFISVEVECQCCEYSRGLLYCIIQILIAQVAILSMIRTLKTSTQLKVTTLCLFLGATFYVGCLLQNVLTHPLMLQKHFIVLILSTLAALLLTLCLNARFIAHLFKPPVWKSTVCSNWSSLTQPSRHRPPCFRIISAFVFATTDITT